MRITRITVYQVTLPIEGGGYRLSGGCLFFDKLDSTILSIETDEGPAGWGEGCPRGSTYPPALDMACWNILGKTAGLPLCELLGGRREEDVVLHSSISTGTPEAVGLKLGRVGGLTKARRMREFCVTTGLRMNIEDTGGSVIADTAAGHLAQATPGRRG